MFCVIQTHKLSRREFFTAAFVLESEAREYLEREFKHQDDPITQYEGRVEELDVWIEIPVSFTKGTPIHNDAGRGGGAGVG